MNFKNYLIVVVRILLGAVFLWASLDKIIDPSKFARDISNYHIIPFGLENIIAIVLPWLEFFIGSGLILMIGGGSEDPTKFSADIFNFQRLTLAPILLATGFVFEIFAVMYKSKEKES